MVGQLSRWNFKNPKGTSTLPKGCVLKIKEIHARVTEFCSENEMRMQDRRTDIRGDDNTPCPHFVG